LELRTKGPADVQAVPGRAELVVGASELLGIAPRFAQAVVDLPWKRLTDASRRQAKEDRDVRQWLRDEGTSTWTDALLRRSSLRRCPPRTRHPADDGAQHGVIAAAQRPQ
jgi:hypothetical protein